MSYYERALPLRRLDTNKLAPAYTLVNMGYGLQQLKNHEKAIALLEEAISIFKSQKQSALEFNAVTHLCNSLIALGHHQDVIDHYTPFVEIYHVQGDITHEMQILFSIGSALLSLKHHYKALERFEAIRSLSQTSKNVFTEVKALIEMGKSADGFGDYHLALDYFEKSLELNDHWNDLRLSALFQMSLTYEHMNSLIRALECAAECAHLSKDPTYRARVTTLENLVRGRGTQVPWWRQILERIAGFFSGW